MFYDWKYRTLNYYTLYDLIRHYEGTTMNSTSYQLGLEQPGEFPALIQQMFPSFIPESHLDDAIMQPITNTLWCKYFANGHLKDYVVRTENEDTVEQAYVDWMTDFVYILDLTYNKYKKLIELYQSEENNLMKQLESTGIVKFNDTPQNTGNFEGDDYTTNVSTTTSKTDSGTIISRLSEIRALYDDIYTAWSNEFKHFFITTARYQDE